jgi:hypothetical protein
MNQVTSILSLTVGQWSGQVLGNQHGSATVQNPTQARVELVVNRTTGVWSITARSLTTIPIQVKVDAAWKPIGALRGPVRILWKSGDDLVSRVITKDGGVITGQRIDARNEEAFVRDRFVANLDPGQIVVVTGSIAPCQMLDIDGDGAVGQSDIAVVLGEWNGGNLAADINRDGIVDAKDLAELLSGLQP